MLMIIMNHRKRKDLDLAIRAHAQAMKDWGQSGEKDDEKKVTRAWIFLNKVIDGDKKK